MPSALFSLGLDRNGRNPVAGFASKAAFLICVLLAGCTRGSEVEPAISQDENEQVLDESASTVSSGEIQYTMREQMVPMRDGIRLYTEIYTPTVRDEPLPIILLRTPYQASNPEGGTSRYVKGTFRELKKDGYILVVQDARGRFKSEGQFIWNRPLAHHLDETAIDASTDAYDTIDWLIKNLPNNNGRVGMMGVSYPGWYTTMALIDPHPALKAASPQASPSDYFINDDFYHHGAFRLGPSAELPYLFDFDPKANSRFPYDQTDLYEFFLDLGPIANMNKKYMKDASPTWNNFLDHPTYDEFWKAGNTLQHLTDTSVPTLHVVGWWDAENLGGALDIYDEMEPNDNQDHHHIVVGPWSHGQWASSSAYNLGAYEFGSNTSEFYQREIEAPWFAYWLKDEGSLESFPEATMFQTGSNEWKRYNQWPPVDQTEQRNLYLHSDQSLSFDKPTGRRRASIDFVSDPDNPVPYSARPIMGFWQGFLDSAVAKGLTDDQRQALEKNPLLERDGRLWKVEDQRFASNRPDVVSFVTEPLSEDLEITGKISVDLFAATTGTDADWVVKLIDVYPEFYPEKPEMGGYQLMIADDVLRGKFRDGFEVPKPITPGEPTRYVINLRTRNHLFRKGHRIMVQIQSSWFPLIDRNPQVFTNIPTAKVEDFQTATHTLFTNADYPSAISLPIARGDQ